MQVCDDTVVSLAQVSFEKYYPHTDTLDIYMCNNVYLYTYILTRFLLARSYH